MKEELTIEASKAVDTDLLLIEKEEQIRNRNQSITEQEKRIAELLCIAKENSHLNKQLSDMQDQLVQSYNQAPMLLELTLLYYQHESSYSTRASLLTTDEMTPTSHTYAYMYTYTHGVLPYPNILLTHSSYHLPYLS